MNKNDVTELVFILDRSGSMAGLEEDTIGGYNALLQKQQKEPGEVIVTTVLFDDQYELLHDRSPIQSIRPMTEKEYFVGGCTALLDAIGKTIQKIVNAHRHLQEEHRPQKVMFVITTDGMENASREYTYEKIKRMIQRQKEEFGWEFLFLGANIDAISAAARFGIGADRAANYHADREGTRLNFMVLNEAVYEYRQSRTLKKDWKKKIDQDFTSRNHKKK